SRVPGRVRRLASALAHRAAAGVRTAAAERHPHCHRHAPGFLAPPGTHRRRPRQRLHAPRPLDVPERLQLRENGLRLRHRRGHVPRPAPVYGGQHAAPLAGGARTMIGQTTWSRELVKTGFLVLVSLFVFIPVYFMLVISVKDGRQFFEHPFVPTWPLHLENYAAAWEHVGPFVGRTAL